MYQCVIVGAAGVPRSSWFAAGVHGTCWGSIKVHRSSWGAAGVCGSQGIIVAWLNSAPKGTLLLSLAQILWHHCCQQGFGFRHATAAGRISLSSAATLHRQHWHSGGWWSDGATCTHILGAMGPSYSLLPPPKEDLVDFPKGQGLPAPSGEMHPLKQLQWQLAAPPSQHLNHLP